MSRHRFRAGARCRTLAGAMLCALLCAILSRPGFAQGTGTAANAAGMPSSGKVSVPPVKDTVIQASSRYGASGIHRFFLGDNYRDLWATPISVPLLDLRTYAGGLHPTKIGGNAQTKSLRFETPTGAEYVFRPVYKERLKIDSAYQGTIVEQIFADGLSASHPAAPVITAPFLQAARILHPAPILFVMPNDTLLGEFREEFAGKLGTLEEYPSKPEEGPAFGGAEDIIDSDKLLEKINKSPSERVDAPTLLRARLLDMLVGDNDRHPGQWKWARLGPEKTAPWEPIPRDRDKAFVSYEGLLLKLGRLVVPRLVTYRHIYPTAMFYNALEFDRRVLGGLERTVWDSTAADLKRTFSDSVIAAAVHAMPPEYQSKEPDLAARITSRRDRLSEAADRYYRALFRTADIHATDAADKLTISRGADGIVSVRLEPAGGGTPYFDRRFSARETNEIRVYLHDGDDTAVVTGNSRSSIPVRVIGGNGRNVLADSSTGGGRTRLTHLYDRGAVESVTYMADSVTGGGYDPDTAWNRRPWVYAYDNRMPPQHDHGSSLVPIVGWKTGANLGFTPKIGFTRYRYGFRQIPYESMLAVEGAYSFGTGGFKVDVRTDRRFESSSFHVRQEAMASQLEVVDFRGFGNDVAYARGTFYEVRQTQWLYHPAVAWAFGPETDLTFGPVAKYVTSDSTPNRFISGHPPLGLGQFGQAGVQLGLHHDGRNDRTFPTGGARVEINASAYPAVWDVESPFERVSASAATYLRIPVLMGPVLALRAGGEKLFGEFPFYEGAFLGGNSSVRAFHYQEFVGDASVYGTTELRVPVARFKFLLPVNLGLLGFVDAGRVYMNGESPGGWHTTSGGGLWLGLHTPSPGVTAMITDHRDRRVMFGLGFAF